MNADGNWLRVRDLLRPLCLLAAMSLSPFSRADRYLCPPLSICALPLNRSLWNTAAPLKPRTERLRIGLIAMTVPDKPRSRLQKYRLTEKGRAWLADQEGRKRRS